MSESSEAANKIGPGLPGGPACRVQKTSAVWRVAGGRWQISPRPSPRAPNWLAARSVLALARPLTAAFGARDFG